MKINILLVVATFFVTIGSAQNATDSDIDFSQWKLIWNDEFDGQNSDLDKKWDSQNGPNNHILCSRWRENAVQSDGVLRLINKRENRGGQEWTSGSVWTKDKFLYGYFECRYKYAAAPATNNSFWLMTQGKSVDKGAPFEIDINEGHYPNEVNTSIHNWTPNAHKAEGKTFSFGLRTDVSLQFEIPIKTKKIRLSSTQKAPFHLREFRIYNVNNGGYPAVISPTADGDVAGLANYAKNAAVTVSGNNAKAKISAITDGDISTFWIAPNGEKWVEFELESPQTVGCIQFINGWANGNECYDMLSNYVVDYHDGIKWVPIGEMNVTQTCNFANEYHTYGLEWTEKELIYYFDRKVIRREPNRFCYTSAPILLSLAIMTWAGEVTDALDGTFMEVDYVRVYNRIKHSAECNR